MTFRNPLIQPGLIERVLGHFVPHADSIHGIDHWRRVERNGLFLAPSSGADTAVVSYFALFHDARRLDDGTDPRHGPRGAAFARELHAAGLVALDESQLETLCLACHGHTHVTHSDDPTIGTCWDADRLDLTRLDVSPHALFLNTGKARDMARRSDFGQMDGIW